MNVDSCLSTSPTPPDLRCIYTIRGKLDCHCCDGSLVSLHHNVLTRCDLVRTLAGRWTALYRTEIVMDWSGVIRQRWRDNPGHILSSVQSSVSVGDDVHVTIVNSQRIWKVNNYKDQYVTSRGLVA